MDETTNIESTGKIDDDFSESKSSEEKDTVIDNAGLENDQAEPVNQEEAGNKESLPEKETKWYVLRVVSGKERKTKEYLDKDVIRNGWDKIIKQVFLPVEKVYKVLNGKKVMRERNFYPGYIMIEVADGKLSDEIIQHLSNVSNVMHFLTDGQGSKRHIISLRKTEVNKMLWQGG